MAFKAAQQILKSRDDPSPVFIERMGEDLHMIN